MLVVVEAGEADGGMTRHEARVLAALRDGKPRTQAEVCERVTGAPADVQAACRSLVARGELKRVEARTGHYTVWYRRAEG